MPDWAGGHQLQVEMYKIEALKESKNQVIYIPTEAVIPVTESARFWKCSGKTVRHHRCLRVSKGGIGCSLKVVCVLSGQMFKHQRKALAEDNPSVNADCVG